ncbi:TetR/AcrR family transcriptional regulator [Hyphomonas sp.]|jgi:AcrR family transcriptional regulator|uniref:TetR/AcrR family transcriptional regulator n=1 Tax=Hyphomonas sp. TaxID=87 RepID=UPI00300134C5|tara:strand:+ start:1780 stop:2364 length:585 start_codon:yes stop_codon:yes gene_type:complete|eukprot:TRINITY_DN259_c0_g1_i1.p1 TRINITY_DN259_c0_g1~~TRINITY_DN259_c0_g1_i1.p1  ORF type:complete len:195 (-),score=31.27 TRINITY_DN259_c0_g1_i1:492-1076(-)
MANRRAKKASETRAAILHAARQRFTHEGFEASLSSIVEDAGITKGALFHHFENKQALYHEVWQELQSEMNRDTQQAALEGRSLDDPYAAMLAGARQYLEWATRPDYQRIVLIDGRAALGIDWYEADFALSQRSVRVGVEYLVQKGHIAPENAASAAVIMQGALNGAGVALSRKVPGVSVDTIYKTIERLLRKLS